MSHNKQLGGGCVGVCSAIILSSILHIFPLFLVGWTWNESSIKILLINKSCKCESGMDIGERRIHRAWSLSFLIIMMLEQIFPVFFQYWFERYSVSMLNWLEFNLKQLNYISMFSIVFCKFYFVNIIFFYYKRPSSSLSSLALSSTTQSAHIGTKIYNLMNNYC